MYSLKVGYFIENSKFWLKIKNSTLNTKFWKQPGTHIIKRLYSKSTVRISEKLEGPRKSRNFEWQPESGLEVEISNKSVL